MSLPFATLQVPMPVPPGPAPAVAAGGPAWWYLLGMCVAGIALWVYTVQAAQRPRRNSALAGTLCYAVGLLLFEMLRVWATLAGAAPQVLLSVWVALFLFSTAVVYTLMNAVGRYWRSTRRHSGHP